MHNLIVGNSLSGKSWLAKHFAQKFASQGQAVAVFDPLKGEGWPVSAVKFADPSLFVEEIFNLKSHYVFIDEAKLLFEAEPQMGEKLAYQGRHWGHMVYFIAQRTAMIPPNARNQCSRVFAFKQQKKDADTLAQEYTPDMHGCLTLRKGEFIVSDGFQSTSGSLDFSGGTPPMIKFDSHGG